MNKIDFDVVEEKLASLYSIAIQIIKACAPIIKKSSSYSTGIYQKLKKQYPDYRIPILKNAVEQVLDTFTNDAESVVLESKKFIVVEDVVVRNKSGLGTTKEIIREKKLNEDDCPYLSQVWSGDMYGIVGLKALKKLEDELTLQLKQSTEDDLFQKCCDLIDAEYGI